MACFGSGIDQDPKIWNSIVRQCLVQNMLKKDIENYGILKLTEIGKSFLQYMRRDFMTSLERHKFMSNAMFGPKVLQANRSFVAEQIILLPMALENL